ncbi:Similarities with uniprot P08640 Saccharomyces cerevisiae YIR019c STA1 [Seminavis robusta]|uniref:Circumsporozoite protein n=1 Tax=Seminavis robusta TaxID=568900 RepID=A0A9N8E6Q5_9STRA|nr:Similarities with uniprot P08640 Saccharomyces cerevisiae YIR019c STA1 [Seminavis robusta]|eukprot:Sro680_g186250.1 Similarities with uniprot P08640 Saccharomyces cerevisiae YIR019c STA1 (567) ;mRNA; r:31032-32818
MSSKSSQGRNVERGKVESRKESARSSSKVEEPQHAAIIEVYSVATNNTDNQDKLTKSDSPSSSKEDISSRSKANATVFDAEEKAHVGQMASRSKTPMSKVAMGKSKKSGTNPTAPKVKENDMQENNSMKKEAKRKSQKTSVKGTKSGKRKVDKKKTKSKVKIHSKIMRSSQRPGSPVVEPTKSENWHPSEAPSSSPGKTHNWAASSSPSETHNWVPSSMPSESHEWDLSRAPSQFPTFSPSIFPSETPTTTPSLAPSGSPSNGPTRLPSSSPSFSPTGAPTAGPSLAPSVSPSSSPSFSPTGAPTTGPSLAPSASPSSSPTAKPSASPSLRPTAQPSGSPSGSPSSMSPSPSPTALPSGSPSESPSTAPSSLPSEVPTTGPSKGPSSSPSDSTAPSIHPTMMSSSPNVSNSSLNQQLIACVSVIDEAVDAPMVYNETIASSWTEFRRLYPERPFCLLQPRDFQKSTLMIPPVFLNDSHAIFSKVDRDYGDESATNNWFHKCNMDHLGALGVTAVALFVDISGSLRLEDVQASHDLFWNTLEASGMTLIKAVYNEEENWVWPFIADY